MEWQYISLVTGAGIIPNDYGHIVITIDATGNIYTAGIFTDANNKAYVAKLGDTPVTPVTTAISQGTSTGTLAFYPNPCQDNVTLTASEAGLLKVSDVSGKMVFTQEVASGDNTISFTTLHKGMYIAVFSGNTSGYALMKFVKE